MTFAIALLGAILGAASLILRVVAPKTKSTLDDKALKVVDSAKDKLGN
jgi:predicted small secreted protein